MNELKKISLIFISLFIGFSLHSCSDDDPVVDNVEFTLSESELNFKTAGDIKQIEITCRGSWRADIEEGEDWLTLSPLSAEKSGTIGIQARQNTTGEIRSGVVYFYANNSTKMLTISQNGAEIEFSSRTVELDDKGTPLTIEVSSNALWRITNINDIEWVTASPTSGEGENFKLTFTPTDYTEREFRGPEWLYFESFGVRDSITVSQIMPNTAPTAPRLSLPSDNSTDIIIYPAFQWEESTDADGDPVTYEISLSQDGTNWTISNGDFEGNAGTCGETLRTNSTYYWKVTAHDPFGGATDSEVFRFTTSSANRYQDGEAIVYQQATAGALFPVILPFTGEGFIEEDYIFGGAFDQAVDMAIEGFFAVEPFKTYRQYFKVYKLAAYSQERGATVKNNMGSLGPSAQSRNTFFSATLDGGGSTGITANDNVVENFLINSIPEMSSRDDLSDIAAQIVINLDAYAGTCWMWSDGYSYALSPTHSSQFIKLINHEGGGHGFGRLLDEYRYEERGAMPQGEINVYEAYWFPIEDRSFFAANIDWIGVPETTHWSYYYTKEGYEAVGFYEGGATYISGAWRPEYNSCMNNNIPYFNAPSREAIVKRIKRIAGEEFTYEDFHAKDLIRNYVEEGTTRAPEMVYPMTAPPVLNIYTPN